MSANRILFLIAVGCLWIAFLHIRIDSSFAASQPSWLSHKANKGVGVYRNPEYGTLTFRVPAEWESRLERDPDRKIETIVFTPPSGNSFMIMVSPLVLKGQKTDFKNQEIAKKQVEQLGSQLLPGAVEDRLDIREIKARYSTGYYYSLTDKAPKPGEWKYLVQGRVGVGVYLLHFTVLTNSANAKEISESLEMFRVADYKKD